MISGCNRLPPLAIGAERTARMTNKYIITHIGGFRQTINSLGFTQSAVEVRS